MQLPGGTTVRAGIIPARPVDTAHGRVQVDALGLIVHAPWAGLRLLHPWRVTVTRPDGASEQVHVRDATGRQLAMLAALGVGVMLLSRALRA